MRKAPVGAAIAVLVTALGIGPASATKVPLLSGTAAFRDSGTAQLNSNGCYVYDFVDGTFATPDYSGSFHSEACGSPSGTGVVETGTVTLTTNVGTMTATEVGTADFTTGAIDETWTVTGGSRAYKHVRGTITMNAQGTFTGPLAFTQSGTLDFNLTRRPPGHAR